MENKKEMDNWDIKPNKKKDDGMWGGLEEDRRIIQKKNFKYGPEGYWSI